MPRTFDYRHSVSFDETNLVGNVYYVNHVRWQGRCRELFLQTHSPSVLQELQRDLALVTVRCSCDYYDEVFAFDEILVRMRLQSLQQNKMTLGFEYVKIGKDAESVVARGEQQVASMRKTERGLVAAPLPQDLLAALQLYSAE